MSKRKAAAVVTGNSGIKVVQACTVAKPAAELFQFWRDLQNLPRFMKHVVDVKVMSHSESHWVVKGPGGNVEWDAIIFNEHPNELIAWRSKEGAEVPNAGSVRFHPTATNEGTEVVVSLEYDPPAGKVGAFLAKLVGEEPSQQVADDLRRFKALMEAGEIPTIEGQPTGKAQRKEMK